MIIKSLENLEPGKVYSKGFAIIVYNTETKKPELYDEHPTYIIRRATREEYIQDSIDNGSPTGNILENDKFYEVSVD